jgi:hypothetical protein
VSFEPIPGTLVIGLGHKARHGKDSAGRVLCSRFQNVKRFSFADDLYAVCRVMHGMGEKDAPLLQRVGMEIRAQRGEDALALAVYAKMRSERPRVAVVTDVRFPNEFAFVKALGGVCWKIERRLSSGDVFVDPSRPATHVSETALDGAAWDRVIVNPEGEPDVFSDRVLCTFMALAVAYQDAEPESVGPAGYAIPEYARMGSTA